MKRQKINKKIISAMCILSFGLLVGCGNKSDEKELTTVVTIESTSEEKIENEYYIGDFSYTVPDAWKDTVEMKDDSHTYFYPENGIVMITKTVFSWDISDKNTREGYIKGASPEGEIPRVDSEFKVSGNYGFSFTTTTDNGGKTYDEKIYVIQKGESIYQFYFLTEQGYNMTEDINSVMSSIK